MKILSLITHPFSELTHSSSDFRELSDPSIDSNDHYLIKVQIRSKDIVKIINVTSVVQP